MPHFTAGQLEKITQSIRWQLGMSLKPQDPPPCANCGCPECFNGSFVTVTELPPNAEFKPDGTIWVPQKYGGFKCANCDTHVGLLPLP